MGDPCLPVGCQTLPSQSRGDQDPLLAVRAQCALTSSDLSSSLGLVLRKWKTVSQGVRSSSGLGSDADGLGGRGWGALSLRSLPCLDGA